MSSPTLLQKCRAGSKSSKTQCKRQGTTPSSCCLPLGPGLSTRTRMKSRNYLAPLWPFGSQPSPLSLFSTSTSPGHANREPCQERFYPQSIMPKPTNTSCSNGISTWPIPPLASPLLRAPSRPSPLPQHLDLARSRHSQLCNHMSMVHCLRHRHPNFNTCNQFKLNNRYNHRRTLGGEGTALCQPPSLQITPVLEVSWRAQKPWQRHKGNNHPQPGPYLPNQRGLM